MSIDPLQLRKEFPILDQQINGKPLIYFDNAATTQKPTCVAEAVHTYLMKTNGNIHRGTHQMANLATEAYENARQRVVEFMNASSKEEVIITKGTTESINLVANSYGDKFVSEGDEIIVSELEHHANIVPWQMLCERKNAILKVIPFSEEGVLDIEEFKSLLSERTKIVSVNHVSNVLGTVNPIKEIIRLAHEKNVPVMIDGAQGIAHHKVDVRELDCDFYAFSAHKIYGPTGVGVLYGKQEWLEKMPPFIGGGEMIDTVTFAKTTYNQLPYKFEAGTPNYIDGIAMGEAIRWVQEKGIDNLAEQEQKLLKLGTEMLSSIDGLRIFGTAPQKASVISFQIEGVHHFDLGTLLDQLGIAVRTGRLCTDPIMDHFGVQGMTRASFSCYNTEEEVEQFYKALLRLKAMF